MDEFNDSWLLEVKPQCMANPLYSLRVRAYALGQYRIQIMSQIGGYDPLGEILQEMCTYKRETMIQKIFELATSDDPVVLSRTWAKPWNCEFAGGRIRLDNEKDDSIVPGGVRNGSKVQPLQEALQSLQSKNRRTRNSSSSKIDDAGSNISDGGRS